MVRPASYTAAARPLSPLRAAQPPATGQLATPYSAGRSGGRADECTGLENRRPARVRGFESLPLRSTHKPINPCGARLQPRRASESLLPPGLMPLVGGSGPESLPLRSTHKPINPCGARLQPRRASESGVLRCPSAVLTPCRMTSVTPHPAAAGGLAAHSRVLKIASPLAAHRSCTTELGGAPPRAVGG